MNSVVLVGRLTRDPDVRYSQDQRAVARFTLAVDRPVRSGGEKQADFPSIVCFGKTAELVEQYVSKGRRVAVSGRIQTGSYTNKDGQKVYTTDVVADRVEFLDSGSGAPRSEGAEPAGSNPNSVPDGFDALDDELPF